MSLRLACDAEAGASESQESLGDMLREDFDVSSVHIFNLISLLENYNYTVVEIMNMLTKHISLNM